MTLRSRAEGRYRKMGTQMMGAKSKAETRYSERLVRILIYI